ncbi:hypothetical protein ADL27_31615, partial [Streptomyces sp. NRRL F-6602]
METAITIMALIFLLLVVVAVYASVKAVKAAKRGVDRTINQARRSYEDTALRARTFGRTGPAGEVAQLRLTLRTSEAATSLRSALRDRAHHDSEDDLGELAEQIRVESGALRHWTSEPAPAAHQKPEPWPEPERTEGGTPVQTWPEGSGAHPGPTPTAIDPATP